MINFTKQEKKAAQLLQSDIPLSASPFEEIAQASGFRTSEMMDWIRRLSQQGIVRKVAAILRHQKAGYENNALVMWSVPANEVEKVGGHFASLPFITHCYERKPAFQGRYNLFTMLHAKDKSISDLIEQMSEATGCRDFLILESLQEYKKTSPEYFS